MNKLAISIVLYYVERDLKIDYFKGSQALKQVPLTEACWHYRKQA